MENSGPFCICRRRTSLCPFVVLLGEVQRVFIIVLNGHEAAVTTMTAHESEGEGMVVLVDLGGSYRLPQPVASIPKDRENVNSQLFILMIL